MKSFPVSILRGTVKVGQWVYEFVFLTSSGVIIVVAGIRNTLRATTVPKDSGGANIVLNKN